MKRIGYLLILVFVASAVFSIPEVMGDSAGFEGVSPGSYKVNFEAGMKKDFVFDFIVNEEKILKVRGDLAKYVKLDKEKILGKERVVASLSLPENVSYFGTSNIWILAGSVAGIIKVSVPYPDKYIRLDLFVPDVNVGEDVIANLKVFNFGKESLNVSPIVEVYSGDNLVGTFYGEERLVRSSGREDYKFSLNGLNYSAGEYLARVFVDEFSSENAFRLGEFKLKILNYTQEVNEGLGKFEVEVESLWDDSMKGVYAEVRIIGRQNDDGQVSLERSVGFDTSIVSLEGWEDKKLIGYFDSEGLEGEVMLSIDVYYSSTRDDSSDLDGGVESEVVRVYVKKRIGWIPWVGIGFVLIFLVWWLWRKSK